MNILNGMYIRVPSANITIINKNIPYLRIKKIYRKINVNE